jgi:hypothetical protein
MLRPTEKPCNRGVFSKWPVSECAANRLMQEIQTRFEELLYAQAVQMPHPGIHRLEIRFKVINR